MKKYINKKSVILKNEISAKENNTLSNHGRLGFKLVSVIDDEDSRVLYFTKELDG